MRHLALLAASLLFVTSACHVAAKLTASVADTRAIESVFPLIERLHVEEYSLDEFGGCRELHDPRGTFMNDTSADSPCDPSLVQEPRLFDALARQDFDALTAAFGAVGVDVSGFTASQAGGVVSSGSFSIGCGDVLIYQPGYGPLEDTEVGPNEKLINAALTPDWYEEASEC